MAPNKPLLKMFQALKAENDELTSRLDPCTTQSIRPPDLQEENKEATSPSSLEENKRIKNSWKKKKRTKRAGRRLSRIPTEQVPRGVSKPLYPNGILPLLGIDVRNDESQKRRLTMY